MIGKLKETNEQWFLPQLILSSSFLFHCVEKRQSISVILKCQPQDFDEL